MQEQISQIKEKALQAIQNAKDAKELDEVRVQYLGKNGKTNCRKLSKSSKRWTRK